MKNTRLGTAVLVFLLSSVTNCSPYSQSEQTDESSLAALTCTANCVSPTIDNLSISANLPSGNQYPVSNDLRDFNIAGDCNEGGYPSNLVTWDLMLNNRVVRNSAMMNTNTKCTNGRFEILIQLTSVSGDPNDRTGLRAGSTRATYQLRLNIFGQTSANGGFQAGNNSSRTFSLIPQ